MASARGKEKRGTGPVESDWGRAPYTRPERGSFLEARESGATHARCSLANVPLFPFVSRPSPALGRVPTAHSGAGANQPHFAAGRRGRRLRPEPAEGIWHTSRPPTPSPAPQRPWDPVGCRPGTPSRTPVPECPAGPLPGGFWEPRWDPPLRSDPASAYAAPFEPAEGGGAIGHALPRPREWTSRGRWKAPPSPEAPSLQEREGEIWHLPSPVRSLPSLCPAPGSRPSPLRLPLAGWRKASF